MTDSDTHNRRKIPKSDSLEQIKQNMENVWNHQLSHEKLKEKFIHKKSFCYPHSRLESWDNGSIRIGG